MLPTSIKFLEKARLRLRPWQENPERQWLGWLSIPFALVFVAWDDKVLLTGGLIAGWICIALSRPQTPGLKWKIFALYPFVMGPVALFLDALFSWRKYLRLF